MTAAALLPLLVFALAASFSPGPNNIMALALCASVGLRRTVPFAAGVVAGFALMVTVVGIGLAVPLARHPALAGAMRWAGAIWLLVLAWKIGSAPGVVPGVVRGSGPGSGPGSVPESGPGSGPGSVPGMAPAMAPGAAPGASPHEAASPMGFWGAVGFQWVNPKAWIMAVASAASFDLPGLGPVGQSLARASVFAAVGVTSQLGWMLLGLGVGRLLATPARLRSFNRAMGALLAVSVVPTLLE